MQTHSWYDSTGLHIFMFPLRVSMYEVHHWCESHRKNNAHLRVDPLSTHGGADTKSMWLSW